MTYATDPPAVAQAKTVHCSGRTTHATGSLRFTMTLVARPWNICGRMAVALGFALLLACEPKENPVLSNERFPEDAYPPNLLLSADAEREAIAAMQATAQGMPTTPLEEAPDAVRWSDVKKGARIAAARAEMAVVKSSLVGETWTFEIETLSGGPAVLTVEKLEPPKMYLATAKVGVFGEDHTKAERLVREFRMVMRRLGKIKRPV